MTQSFESSSIASNPESVLPLLQKFYSLEQIAKEPWSDESLLYIPEKNLILIENGAGAESLASFIYLKVLDLKFEVKYAKNVNEMSPSGRSPLLKCGRFSIGEFESIVNFCHLKGYKLNGKSSPDANEEEKRTLLKTYLLFISKSYSDLITHFLWKEEQNQKLLESSFTDVYPWPLGKLLYLFEKRFVKNKLVCKNIWNLNSDKMLNQLAQVNDSLNKKLNGNLYLFENELSEVDILLYSFIRVLKSHEQFQQAVKQIENFPNLIDFFVNMNTKFNHFKI